MGVTLSGQVEALARQVALDQIEQDIKNNAKFLSVNGGALDSAAQINQSVDTSAVKLFGGTSYESGASLSLSGKAREGNAGKFVLTANDGSQTSSLSGAPNGSLQWKGKNVVRSVNGAIADVDGEVTVTSLGNVAIPANQDLNNYKTVGQYSCAATADAKTLANCPIQSAFTLTVLSGSTYQQILRQYSGQSVWIRTYQDWNNTWTSWVCSGGSASVISTWSSGKNWYRVWSDGWIEQGGYSSGGKDGTKTTFHKAFSNTNYNVIFQQITSDSYANTCYPTSMTTTSVVIYARITANFYWYACGF